MNGTFTVVIVCILVIMAMLLTPLRVLNAALARAQVETPPAISNAIVRAGSRYIPDSLLAHADAAVTSPTGESEERQTIGGALERSANAVSSRLHGVMQFGLRFIESVVLLYPLRIAAFLPYLLLYAVLLVAALLRKRKRQEVDGLDLEVDTSGDVKDPPAPIRWSPMVLAGVVVLLLLPLPCPVWIAGAVLCMHPLLLDLNRPPRRIPVLTGE